MEKWRQYSQFTSTLMKEESLLRLKPSVIWLLAMTISYFWCLPIGQISHVSLTDIRLYDVVFLVGFILFILPNLRIFGQIIRRYDWVRAYFQFASWAAISILVTFLLAGFAQAFIAVGRLARFIAYGLVHVAVLAFVNNRTTLVWMVWLFFSLIVIESIVSFLQTKGIIPQLWPDYWLYYGNLPVGTLGPHHLHMGSIAVVGSALFLGLLGAQRSFLLRALIAPSIGFIIYSAFSVGSRSAYLGFCIVILAYLSTLFERQNRFSRWGIILWAVLGLGTFLYWGGQEVTSTIEQQWTRGVESRYKSAGSLSGLSPTRVYLWSQTPEIIVSRPWVLITGCGLQNSDYVLHGGNAMHNNYLHVLLEMGLFGLYLYLRMLLLILRQARQVMKMTDSLFGYHIARGVWMAFVAILFLNLANENFYMQYSLFSFTGQLMLLAGIAMHPLWIHSEQMDQNKWKLYERATAVSLWSV